MKKIISSILVIVLLVGSVCILQSCGNPEIPDDFKPLNLSGLSDEYKSNSLRVEEKYVDEWCEIVCTVNEIVSEKHFTMFSTSQRVYIDCWVKNNDLKDVLLDLNKGDEIIVYGIVTKMYSSASISWDVNIHINVYKIDVL